MKRNPLSLPYRRIAFQALLLGVGMLIGASAGAQNLLKNGNFDDAPLGPTNWMVLYLVGGPESWEIKGRATPSGPHHSSFYDGMFRPIDQKLAHVCFAQTVTNLTAGYSYAVSGLMREDWWKGIGDAKRGKYQVYIEAIGGQGDPTPDGRASVKCVATDQSNLDAPYTFPNTDWLTFTNRQTPDANRKIEIRLHYDMTSSDGTVEWDKCWLMAGYFDAISLTQ